MMKKFKGFDYSEKWQGFYSREQRKQNK